jgi:hypothetical protein
MLCQALDEEYDNILQTIKARTVTLWMVLTQLTHIPTSSSLLHDNIGTGTMMQDYSSNAHTLPG